MEEIWKDIPDYEGFYQVSNLGRVKSLSRLRKSYKNTHCLGNEKILKPSIDIDGYFRVALCKNKIYRKFKNHQLVAMAFLGHKPDGTQKIVVDHINNVKTDNRVENLQLITNRKNASKDRMNGTSKYVGVSWYKSSKKWVAQIVVKGKNKNLGYFHDEYEAHLAYQAALKSLNE